MPLIACAAFSAVRGTNPDVGESFDGERGAKVSLCCIGVVVDGNLESNLLCWSVAKRVFDWWDYENGSMCLSDRERNDLSGGLLESEYY